MALKETNKDLYTIIKNNTDRRVLLTSYGNLRNGNLAPNGFLVYPGYMMADIPGMRLRNVYNTINNGSLSIYVVLRTPTGYQAMQLGADTTTRIDEDGIAALIGALPRTDTAATQNTATSAPEVGRKHNDNRLKPGDDGFTVRASGSSKTAAMLGAKIADVQPESHTPLNTDLSDTYGAAKIGSGTMEAKKAAEQIAESAAEPAAEAPKQEAEPKEDKNELEKAVDACYAERDWDRLMMLLEAQWPDVKFSKPSVMRLKSLAGIKAKYELV